MTLYCIAYEQDKQITDLLQEACEKESHRFKLVNPKTFDYTEYEQPSPGDAVYRVASGQGATRPAIALERFLINEKIATFYKSITVATTGTYGNSHVMFQKKGIPIPKTINHLTRDRSQLKKYVEELGGFPIIVKVLGGSHGVGVIKVDTFPALTSLLDYIDIEKTNTILREYIPGTTHARLVVLGERVTDSIEYTAPSDDFRTNVGSNPSVVYKKYPDEIENVAIQALALLNIEFGGIDVLFDAQSNPRIAEVNFPCNFARAQTLTGTDTARSMVKYLAEKVSRI